MSSRLARHLAVIASRAGVPPVDGAGDTLERLLRLNSMRALSGLHAVMQFTLALVLYSEGYDVWVEYELPGGLVADLYAEGPPGSVVVEVETGYVDPSMLHSPSSYLESKIALKAAQYSGHADLFVLAAPAYVELPIPRLPPASEAEAQRLARLIEVYQGRPAERILEHLRGARIDLVVSVDPEGPSVEPHPRFWWDARA